MSCPVGTDVEFAASLICEGKLVAFPTETVYGLGAHALDPLAVARVFDVKNRPRFDPLIVHIADVPSMKKYAIEIPNLARRLADRFWPGPLTIVLKKHDIVPDLVTAGLQTVALRMPNHPLALELIEKSECPIAAPSANPFGAISPTSAEHVMEQLGDSIDYILDGGPCTVGLESTVISLAYEEGHERPLLLRPGGLPAEQIEKIAGPFVIQQNAVDEQAAPSPGMLPRHYAPTTPLAIVEDIESFTSNEKVGFLSFGACSQREKFETVEILSEKQNLVEAAAKFYAALRRLDAMKLDTIVVVPFPDEGLGRALNDRLTRASHG